MAIFTRKKKKDPSAGSGQVDSKKSEDLGSKEKGASVKMKDLYKTDTKKEAPSAPSTGSTPEDGQAGQAKDEKKGKDDKKEVVEEKKGKGYDRAYEILVRPIVTEKISDLGEQDKYAFEVALKANKIEVIKAVEGVYGIRPIKVNMIKVKGKKVRMGVIKGKRKDWKKAVVTLPKGENINIYEGI